MLRRDILKLSTLCLGTAASGSVSRALLADVTADSAVVRDDGLRLVIQQDI